MKFVYLIVILVCLGCSSDQKRDYTYIGGRIVNPNSNYVILEHNDELIDTIPIDSDNNFELKFTHEEEAVFSFKHYPESQNVYLKPGDSTVLRVNTLDFDESLSFGGSSSEENNFLINMFLLNEKDNDLILSYYKITPQRFIKKTDSIINTRLLELEKLKSKSDFTPFFENIAEKTIKYEHYDMRERYAFLMNKYVPNKFDEFPEDYFDYRKEVNFNDSNLISNFSYMRFLDNYLRNKSIEICETDNRDCYDLNNHENLKRRLDLVLKLFENEYLKSNFFNRLIRREIVFSKTESQLKETLEIIGKFELKSLDNEELHQLTNIQNKYLLGRNLKLLNFRTSAMDTVALEEISKDKPVVMYTWSALSFESKKNNLYKINKLIKQYPEIDFISLNLDFQNPSLWTNALKRFNHVDKKEYQVISDAPNNTYGFFKNYISRVYILDKNHNVTNNSLNLFDPNLEKHILSEINK